MFQALAFRQSASKDYGMNVRGATLADDMTKSVECTTSIDSTGTEIANLKDDFRFCCT